MFTKTLLRRDNMSVITLPSQAINDRVAKVGVGAYLTSPATTAVTTAYTRLLGTFTNVELEGFELDGTSGKLMYNPDDGLNRTFLLLYSGNVQGASSNDIVIVGIEITRDSVSAITSGTEVATICRVASSPYPFAKVFPLSLEVGDLIELQVKGDSSFTLTMDEFATTLTKFY